MTQPASAQSSGPLAHSANAQRDLEGVSNDIRSTEGNREGCYVKPLRPKLWGVASALLDVQSRMFKSKSPARFVEIGYRGGQGRNAKDIGSPMPCSLLP
eukprot:1158046-Pelagomonas_calceolata.AAC.3